MKNTWKYPAILLLAATLTTGCIKEELPTNRGTNEQVGQSAMGLVAAVNAMNSWLCECGEAFNSHGDFGWPGICMGMDAMTCDVACGPGFSTDAEFLYWRAINSYDADGRVPYFPWIFLNRLVLLSNSVLRTVDLENPSDIQKTYIGQALVYRAMANFHLARIFEYKGPLTGGYVGLTVPIVKETTSEAEGQNNPRATHDEMYAFIEQDLLTAIDYLEGFSRTMKNKVDKAVACGMLARVYLQMERYADAASYARQAIDLSGARVLTQEEWTDPKSGFNDIQTPSWLWGIIITKDNRAVTTGVANFISFMALEATYGYMGGTGYSSVKQCDAALFAKIPKSDFRRLSWLAPGEPRSQYQSSLDVETLKAIPDYSALKFRPAEGNGTDHLVGSAADFPLMRVEEMYLIEAEGKGYSDVGQGKQLLEAFAQTRNPKFKSMASSFKELQDEIFLQRQIEFWGEGIIMFDYKRLDKPQMNGYKGTNHFDGSRYNSPDGNAPWTTPQLPTEELQSNKGVTDAQQNPNPNELRGTEWIEQK